MIADPSPHRLRSGGQEESAAGRLLGLLEDHLTLLCLETGYEAEAGRKRLILFLVAAVSFFLGLCCLQVAGIVVMIRSGASLGAVCAACGVFWGVVGVLFLRKGRTRAPGVGDPFQSSRIEFRRSLKWIRNHFS